MTNDIQKLADHLFRRESGKMVAVLSKLMGLQHIEVAEDIVQDTLVQAMQVWSYKGIPDNPAAWLYRVAKNKAIDKIRRSKKFHEISEELSYLLKSEYSLSYSIHNVFLENEISDSQLRMIFACCHPAIPQESQIALALKTLCGLDAAEIARAFLTNEETINKRIYRGKEKIRSESIRLEVPHQNGLAERMDTVLKTLYLVFNEGYNSTHSDKFIREDLCAEAIRLTFILTGNTTIASPRTKALLALFSFQASRLSTRIDDKGHMILLKYQDRSKWDRQLIAQGFHFIDEAAEPFEISSYHFEAAIASLHAAAPTFEKTDWKSIYHLYEMLYQLQPNPVIAMNKAIASAYAINKENALNELTQIKGLENHHLYYASIGEMHFELENRQMAKDFFEKAILLTESPSERQLLIEKISLC